MALISVCDFCGCPESRDNLQNYQIAELCPKTGAERTITTYDGQTSTTFGYTFEKRFVACKECISKLTLEQVIVKLKEARCQKKA